MRRNIYIDKETQAILETLPTLNVSHLVREVLQNHTPRLVTVRVVKDAPTTTSGPQAFVLEEKYPLLDQTTILYEVTIQDMDRLGATRAHLEWYDTSTESWRKSE